MLTDFFVTKIGMTQAWTKDGKRVAVTRCSAATNMVVAQHKQELPYAIFEIGHGSKKLANMSKPLRSKLQQGGFSVGAKKLTGIRVAADAETVPTVGQTISIDQVLQVGDIVQVQGISKGRGFAGTVKRHGFAGGPKTHGQSDRQRAPGSIGSGTTPGRVWKGLRMAGHYGVETKTVKNLVVLHIDAANNEIWLSGPVPGHIFSELKITKLGETKKVELDTVASNIPVQPVATDTTESATEVTTADSASAADTESAE